MFEALPGTKKDTEQLVLEFLENHRADLKDLIILQCSPMVERIARRFSGVEQQDDLVQVGYIGLLNALSKFDPKAGVRFNTYATHLIAGEIKHYLRDRSQIIRHPAWVQELRQRLAKASLGLQIELGRAATEREIAETCGISEQAVREVFAAQDLMRVSSLDAPIQEDEDGESDIDKLDSTGPCVGQVSVEDRVVLESAMEQLRDLEREVLVMFHFDSLNQTEIAARLDISCNYVSHILRQSLGKLRKILTQEEEADRGLRQDSPGNLNVIEPETNSYTEEYFRGRLTEEVHRAVGTDEHVGIVLVQFKGLDTLRSFFGDSSVSDLLADSADFLRSSVRRLDVVCRYGDAGFGIILPGSGVNGVLVRQRLGRRFAQWMTTRTASSSVTVQIGFATAPEHAKSANDLILAAENANRDEQMDNAA